MSAWTGAADPRFFARGQKLSLAEIARVALAEPPSRPLTVSGIAPLQTAGPDEISFLDNRRYAEALAATSAGAVIIHPDMAARVPAGSVAVVTREPYLAWARVAALFHPPPPVVPGIHPAAVIEASARIDVTAEIGALAVIEAGAEIGARTRVGAGAVIGPGVVVGADCRIGAHASLSHALLGDRVYIYPGARIGQEGFGFATSDAGFVTVPQLGRVLIGDDVEVGANSTIDRGSAQDTVVGAGSRLDNLVQVGHNVTIGRACVIVSQVGISGSAIIEDFVMIGGQAGVTGHLRIGRGARIGAQAGVMTDVPAGEEFVFSPAQPARPFFRMYATLRRLAEEAQVRKRPVPAERGPKEAGPTEAGTAERDKTGRDGEARG